MRTVRIAAALFVLAFVTGIAGLAGSPALAQATEPSPAAPRALRGADRNFVLAASQDNLDEVRLGRLAADKASNADVKAFAQRMVNDHAHAQHLLMAIPVVKQAHLPQAAMDMNARNLQDRLSRLSGHQFDVAYMQAMVSDHNEALQTFDQATRAVDNPDLRHWAAETMTVLREHLRQARQILQEVQRQGR